MMQNTYIKQLNDNLDPSQWPEFIDGELSEAKATLNFVMSPELDYFRGHFPEQPVLPGVVQVHWAGELARRLFACEGFSSLSKVKFSGVISPETSLNLCLDYRAELGRVDFCYQDAQQKYSSGSLSFQGDS